MSAHNQGSPPLPRDYDHASFSELVPIRSTKIKLLRSPLFFFVIITALACCGLFVLGTDVDSGGKPNEVLQTWMQLVDVVVAYLLLLTMLAAHSYTRTDRSVLYYLFPVAFVVVFLNSPLLGPYLHVFDILMGPTAMNPVNPDGSPNGPGTRFLAAFTEPGLREELIKGTPALVGALLTLHAASWRSRVPARLYDLLRVRGPLDGVLMGMGAGAAFIFVETAGQYVPGQFARVYHEGHDFYGAINSALMLLIPRVINGMVGHVAYSAVVGYGIGLGVVRRKQFWKLAFIGWMVGALLHALWDTGLGMGANLVIALLSGLIFVACLMKARQMEAVEFGRAQDTQGSIIVDYPVAAAPAAYATAAMAYAPLPPAAPAYAPPAVAPAAAALSFALAFPDMRVALKPGELVDLSQQPALGGRGQGVRAEVSRHPTKADVVGLKNLGAAAWYARMADGTVQPVDPQRNLRLAPGLRIDFGSGLTAEVAVV